MLKNISLLISKQLAILVVLATLFSLYYPQVGSNLVKTSWVVYIFGKNLCAKIPSTIGTITTLTTLKNIAITFTSIL